ncbi:MAG: hypothetical protein ACI9TH_002819 [Kiritimatiellia bacterium]|jgi:hypothetical protein
MGSPPPAQRIYRMVNPPYNHIPHNLHIPLGIYSLSISRRSALRFVRIVGDRPDFRVFISLLYSDFHNVDTDRDSHPGHSRKWTYLYIEDRSREAPSVCLEVCTHSSYFSVSSDSERLEELTALYLLEYCGDQIMVGEKVLSEEVVTCLKSRYVFYFARAQGSVWHQSSDQFPYPNLIT